MRSINGIQSHQKILTTSAATGPGLNGGNGLNIKNQAGIVTTQNLAGTISIKRQISQKGVAADKLKSAEMFSNIVSRTNVAEPHPTAEILGNSNGFKEGTIDLKKQQQLIALNRKNLKPGTGKKAAPITNNFVAIP